MALEWNKLLCTRRVRELFGGHPSKPGEGEDRSEFERDYDRAVFSTPVRRLQDKTQVFPLEPNDAVRTRLTHSLEVSTLARGVARSAARWMAQEGHIGREQVHDIESIAATCGLIHDLGNPPFGHAGEKAISSWFEKKLEADEDFFEEFEQQTESDKPAPAEQLRQDFLKFEGNAQMLRIVSKLQLLAGPHGLNLTVGTLSAAMKYTAASHEASKKGPRRERAKPGFFASERELVDTVRQYAGTGDRRNPIAYLVEACDDMVYATIDIEDGVKKGVVDWRLVSEALDASLSGGLAKRQDLDPGELGRFQAMLNRHLEGAKTYIDRAMPPLKGKVRDEALAHHFRTLVIGTTKAAILDTFRSRYEDIMSGEYTRALIEDSDVAPLIEACKSVGVEHVYCSDETLRLETMGRRVIHDLMDFFWEGAEAYAESEPQANAFEGKIYKLLSSNYRMAFTNALEAKRLPRRYHQFQLVTDYVCGMTDSFACKLHAQLTNG